MNRLAWLLLGLFVAIVSCGASAADPPRCAAAFSVSTQGSKALGGSNTGARSAPVATHAWLITPDARGVGGLIWHIPPRGPSMHLGVGPGVLRPAADVPRLPVGIGAVADRLYMIFDERSEMPSGKPREVVFTTATATGVAPGSISWVTRPVGRFDVAASLRSDGRVLSSAGTPHGLAVLMHGLRDHGADPERVYLFVLYKDEWRAVGLPAELIKVARSLTARSGNKVSMNAAWSVHAATDGLLIAVEETPGSLQLWRAKELNASAAAGGTAGSEMEFASWERASAELALSGGRVLAQVLCDGVDLVAMAVSPDGSTSVSVASLPEAWRVGQILRFSDLASFGAGVPPGKFATATMLGSALGALVRPEVMVVGEGDGLRGAAGMALGGGRLLAELSLGTGRVQAVTAVAPQNPVSAADYRLMGVMLLLIGGTIVIFLAKPPGPDAGAISLPPSTALADPIQRIIAGGIDVLIASVLGTGLWRLPVGTLGSAEWWGSSGSLTVIATILVILIVLGAVCESIFGRTPGKLMTGCEVVVIPRTGVAKAPEHPGLVLAIVRNIIKWIAPPIALLGLLELSRRHRADMWSSTVVVERFEEEADEG